MSKDLIDEKNTASSVSEDEYTYKPRTRSSKNKVKTNNSQKKEKTRTDKSPAPNSKSTLIKAGKITSISLASLVVVSIITITAFAFTLPKDKIANNISIASLDASSMSEDDAIKLITDMITDDTLFTVTSADKTTEFMASDIGLKLDVQKTVDNAMSIGKSNNFLANGIDAMKLMTKKVNVPLAITYNDEKLNDILFEFGASFNGESTKRHYEYTEDSVTIIPGTAGQNQDTKKAAKAFINSVENGEFTNIAVPLNYAEPEQVSVSLLYSELNREPQNAEYKKLGDGSIMVTDDVWGAKISKDDLKDVISRINSGETVTISAKTTPPEKTKKDLEELLFSSTLGTYSSDFSSSTANRAHNVTLASNSINSKTLMPGEIFSYTEAIGNPSLANGYKMASVFENGKTTEGVGGGVCQVSSTLYGSVLYADLEIVERKNHSLTVSYVPKGQDATFAYGLIDFRFKNDTEYPIKINSTVNGRKLTVSILGTDVEPGKEVKINNVHVSTVAPSENVTEDPTLPQGTKKITSSGKNGYIYDTYKVIYKNGVQVSNKKISRSVYKSTPAEVLVGTGEIIQSPAPSEDANNDNPSAPEESTPVTSSPSKEDPETTTPDTDISEKPVVSTTNPIPETPKKESQSNTTDKESEPIKTKSPSSRPSDTVVEDATN